MATYANGQIPTSAMTGLSVGGFLLPAAASNFELWRAHAAQDGFNLTITSAADAFRTYATQERIFRERYTTTYLPGRPTKVWQNKTWWLRPGQATAAVPGTSNHGKGLAVDIRNAGSFNGSFYKWMSQTGPAYGFSNAEGRSINEPWHWVSDNIARGAIGAIATAVTNSVDTPTSPLEDDMARLIRHPNGSIALVGPGAQMRVLHTVTEVQAMQATGQATGETIQLPNPLIWTTCAAVAQRAGVYSG